MNQLSFNVLVEDTLNIKEHGLSIYINAFNHKLIFDTGQSRQFLKELSNLNINIGDIDAIVISHGHYDHANGLRYIDTDMRIHIHKDALKPKFKHDKGMFKYNGIDESAIEIHRNNFLFVKPFTQIFENIYTIGGIKPISKNPKFLTDKNIQSIDDFHDEIILVIENTDGMTVFMGCSHFGVVEGLKKVKEYFPNKPIKNVIAGMHLLESDEESINNVIKSFIDFEVNFVYPLHCTGDLATKLFKKAFKERCIIVDSSRMINL